MAEPKCPSCGAEGIENIVSRESEAKSPGGDPWFEVAFCNNCGHIYGVFPKHVLSHDMPKPVPPLSFS